MNINARGALLVKADRINQRVDDMARMFLKFKKNEKAIAREDFVDFIKTVHLIVDTELNDKGVERQWRE